MTQHYHVVAAKNQYQAISSVRFDNYEDSVETWVRLSNMLFKHIDNTPGAFAIENAINATLNGDGYMARVGTFSLCLYWMRCETDCFSTTWN